MTSRNLTEVFFLMRNNAVQNRNMYDDRVNTLKTKTYGNGMKEIRFVLDFLEAK